MTELEHLAERLRERGDEPLPLFPVSAPPEPVDLDGDTL